MTGPLPSNMIDHISKRDFVRFLEDIYPDGGVQVAPNDYFVLDDDVAHGFRILFDANGDAAICVVKPEQRVLWIHWSELVRLLPW